MSRNAEAAPGARPGVVPGVVPGVLPGVLPAVLPEVVPGSVPGMAPAAVPGAVSLAGPAAPPPIDLGALVAAARAARERAHAPYSRFAVGAAVVDEQGRIHAGCNVENAAYPQGWCAETSALAAMVLAGGRRVRALAVCGVAAEPVTPCGGCRQKLREFADDACPVWVADLDSVRASFTLGELLPASFGPHHLNP